MAAEQLAQENKVYEQVSIAKQAMLSLSLSLSSKLSPMRPVRQIYHAISPGPSKLVRCDVYSRRVLFAQLDFPLKSHRSTSWAC